MRNIADHFSRGTLCLWCHEAVRSQSRQLTSVDGSCSNAAEAASSTWKATRRTRTRVVRSQRRCLGFMGRRNSTTTGVSAQVAAPVYLTHVTLPRCRLLLNAWPHDVEVARYVTQLRLKSPLLSLLSYCVSMQDALS